MQEIKIESYDDWSLKIRLPSKDNWQSSTIKNRLSFSQYEARLITKLLSSRAKVCVRCRVYGGTPTFALIARVPDALVDVLKILRTPPLAGRLRQSEYNSLIKQKSLVAVKSLLLARLVVE